MRLSRVRRRKRKTRMALEPIFTARPKREKLVFKDALVITSSWLPSKMLFIQCTSKNIVAIEMMSKKKKKLHKYFGVKKHECRNVIRKKKIIMMIIEENTESDSFEDIKKRRSSANKA